MMLLGFHPAIYIDQDWTGLKESTLNVADEFVKSGKYQEFILYEQGASLVAEIPTGGWISKSGPSNDFFVMGGIPEIQSIGNRIEKVFPELTFTPPTMCYSSGDVPLHRDHIKNGLASLVYPLHKNDSIGMVYDPQNENHFYYSGTSMWPTIINIREYHRVYNQESRVWFSIHLHQPIELVKQVFDRLSPVMI